jgi:glycosyltransferase involved in cell wall biosynthesis
MRVWEMIGSALQQKTPKISVVSIASNDEELNALRKALTHQTYHDFELVVSTKGTIPEAWNDAISRAHGEFILFMESDSLPLNDSWLEELSKVAQKGRLVKGIEIKPFGLNMTNLIADATIFSTEKFDKRLKTSEDTEMFARLKKLGVSIQIAPVAPVIHAQSVTWRKTLTRSIRGGMLFALINYKYGSQNTDSVRTEFGTNVKMNPISNRFRIITENLLILLGLAIGSIMYIPVLISKKRSKSNASF